MPAAHPHAAAGRRGGELRGDGARELGQELLEHCEVELTTLQDFYCGADSDSTSACLRSWCATSDA